VNKVLANKISTCAIFAIELPAYRGKLSSMEPVRVKQQPDLKINERQTTMDLILSTMRGTIMNPMAFR
jgi:hypothetical protein